MYQNRRRSRIFCLRKLLASLIILLSAVSVSQAQLQMYIPEMRCSAPNYMLRHWFSNTLFSARADILTPVGTSFKGYYYIAYSCNQTESTDGTIWGGKRNFACVGKTGLGAYTEVPEDGLNMELFEEESSSVSPAIGTTEKNLYYIYYEDQTRQYYYYRLQAADGSAELVDKKPLSGMDGISTGFTACRYRTDQILVMGFDGTGMICCIYREVGTDLQLERQIRLSQYTCYQMNDITPSSIYLSDGQVCLAWTGGGYRPHIALFENNTVTKSFSYGNSSFPGGMKAYGHNPTLFRMENDPEIHLFYRGQKSGLSSNDPKLYHTSFTESDFQYDGAEVLQTQSGPFQSEYSPVLIPGIPGKSANMVFVQASGSPTGLSFFNSTVRFVPLYRWQGDNLADQLTLKKLILPGTHFSAMTSGDDYFNSPTLQTSTPSLGEEVSCSDCNRFNQIYTIEDQLNAGVRYLDIPLGASGGNYTDPKHYHAVRLVKSTDPDENPAVCDGTKLTDIMTTLEVFLKAHPSEFVILHLSNGDGQIDKIRSYFQSKSYLLYQRQEGEHTLNDVVNTPIAAFRGKVILVTDDLYDSESFGALHNSGTLNLSTSVKDASDLYAYQKNALSSQAGNPAYKIAHWYTTNLTAEQSCPEGDLASCLKQPRSFTKSISQAFRCGSMVFSTLFDLYELFEGNLTKAVDLTKMGFSILQSSLIGRGLSTNKGLASDLHDWKNQGVLTPKSMPNVVLMDAYEYWNADICIELTDALNQEEHVSLYNGSIDVDARILAADCGLENGQIQLRAYGAYPPFAFHWVHKATVGDSLTGLSSGYYTGYVIDRRGHKKAFSYRVPIAEESFKSLASGVTTATAIFPEETQERYFSGDCNTLIAKAQLKPGNDTVLDVLSATVWAGAGGQQAMDSAFVPRAYEIRHLTNGTAAPGWLTLYYTKAEWEAYNHTHTDRLPEWATDTVALKRICLVHYNSISTDGSGRPQSFSGIPQYLFPSPQNVQFNNTLGCWEVRVYTEAMGGFFLKTYNDAELSTWISGTVSAETAGRVARWTVEERRAYRYYVQKSTDGGRSFSTLQMIPATGYGKQSYQITDTTGTVAPLNHSLYYQVVLVDRSGSVLLRKMLTTDPDSQPLRVYPNPAGQEVHIESAQATTAVLVNLQGSRLSTFDLGVGDNVLQTASLPPGLYFIRTAQGQTAKLVINR